MKISKVGYYVLNTTWGIIMTLFGALLMLVMICIGKKPKRHGGAIYVNVGKNWGGLSLGMFFFTDSFDVKGTKDHEFGHSLQNCIWGPLFPFVIGIPSAIRYWLRECKSIESKKTFSAIVVAVLFFVSAVFLVIPGAVGYCLTILALVYVLAILIWLFSCEIPKYVSDEYVPYDAIWFEHQASTWGEKIFKKWS